MPPDWRHSKAMERGEGVTTFPGTLRGFASLLNYLNDSAEESIEELSSIPRV